MSEQYALLVEKVEGYKKCLSDNDYPLSYENITIPVGSFVKHLLPKDIAAIRAAYKLKVNYSVNSSCSKDKCGALLYASSDQLYQLKIKHKDLLLAVDLTDRIDMLQKLCWVEYLVVGSEVYTTIDTIPIPVKGVVRFIGELSGVEGIRFGIELLVSAMCVLLFHNLIQKQPSCRKGCNFQEDHCQKDVKSKGAVKNGCDGRLIMTIQVNLVSNPAW